MESNGKVFSEDLEVLVGQLLKRVEALEAEVALLKGETVSDEAVSLDPIDLDFGVEVIAAPSEVISEAKETVPETKEEEAAPAEIPIEEEPVTLEESPEEPAIVDEPQETQQEDLPEETPAEQPAPEPAPEDLPDEAPVQEKEEIPMEDLPEEDIDDLPFDLPEEDAPYEIPVEEAPAPVVDEQPKQEEIEDLPNEEPEVSADLPAEETPAEDGFMDLFGDMMEPEAPVKKGRPKKAPKSINDAVEVKETVMDSMFMDSAWRKDIQGPEVRDVRSAISLNDRVLFINRLFRKDSMLYQDVIGKINGMNDLDEVVTFLHSTFPEWNMDSEDVYKFMMAVRRKIR
jgi:hypothetical protein